MTLGLVATVTAIIWARHQDHLSPLLAKDPEPDEDPEPLNQAELHAAFVHLQKILSALKSSHVLRLAPLAATACGLLLLTTVLPGASWSIRWLQVLPATRRACRGSSSGR